MYNIYYICLYTIAAIPQHNIILYIWRPKTNPPHLNPSFHHVYSTEGSSIELYENNTKARVTLVDRFCFSSPLHAPATANICIIHDVCELFLRGRLFSGTPTQPHYIRKPTQFRGVS